jgi:hypothetical protein
MAAFGGELDANRQAVDGPTWHGKRRIADDAP